jgi:hypothetical protein
MRTDNSHHLVAAARRRSAATHERAVTALRRLDATGRPVSFDIVAREAGVSRSWLYAQPDLRAEIEQLRTRHDPAASFSPSVPIPARQRASDASLRHRLETAGAEIRRLREENRQLRERLAWAHGELRTATVHGPTGNRDPSERSRSAGIGPCS